MVAIRVDDTASHEHPAIAQEDGRMAGSALAHGPGIGPSAAARVVELSGGERQAETTAAPAHDEDVAIRQECRRVQMAALVDGAGGAK